jgi:uncharacterized protein (DUF302 family)
MSLLAKLIASLMTETLVFASVATMFSGEQDPSVDGLITIRSDLGPKETINRLRALICASGMKVIAHIDQTSSVQQADVKARSTDLLIFDRGEADDAMIKLRQTISLDLPLKILVWEDDIGNTLLSYNDLAWVAHRHGVSRTDAMVDAASNALRLIAEKATGVHR